MKNTLGNTKWDLVLHEQIINKDNVEEGDREANGYIISGRIMVVLRSAEIPDNSILWLWLGYIKSCGLSPPYERRWYVVHQLKAIAMNKKLLFLFFRDQMYLLNSLFCYSMRKHFFVLKYD